MKRNIIIGTAGHVDHGKSRLVEALTGTHPDRLLEEHLRGITIDLGFAGLDLPGFGRAGLVDVPGHERFVRTMVAGAAGIDLVLLVIALDEGVMPQTLEHIDICSLLGVKKGVIAITKADLEDSLDPEWESLVRSDISDAIKGTFLENAPVISVSAENRRGLPDLLEALSKTADEVSERDRSGPLFMPVDRAFTMKGFGTVITGTLLSGTIKPDQEIDIVPMEGKRNFRIRGLQVHGESVDQAFAGQRTAINLSGISKDRINRGHVLVSPDSQVTGRLLDTRLSVLKEYDRVLRQRSKMKIHVGSARAEATITLLEGKDAAPGTTVFAQIHLDRPLAVLPGQPFILRSGRVQEGRGRTVGGGLILGPAIKRRRPGRPDSIAGMEGMASDDPLIRTETVVRQRPEVAESSLPWLTGLPRRSIKKAVDLLTSKTVLILADSEKRLLIHRDKIIELEKTTLNLLRKHHEIMPLSLGLSREALRSSLPGPPAPRIFNILVSRLSSDGSINSDGSIIGLAGYEPAPADDSEDISLILKKIENSGLSPPRWSETINSMGIEQPRARAILNRLVEDKRIVRVGEDMFFSSEAIADLQVRLLAFLDKNGGIDTQEFKELTGTTRRHAIPLAEYFDRIRLTLRTGDRRIKRKKT